MERHLEARDTGCVRRDRAGDRVLAVAGRVPEREVEGVSRREPADAVATAVSADVAVQRAAVRVEASSVSSPFGPAYAAISFSRLLE